MPTGAAVASFAPEGAKKTTFRPDIQGLRMIAVVAVILDHLIFWPSGGFVGVDVFFVISGFLITSLLLREHDKSGTISFSGFYRRRLKRILPAGMLVIVATVAVGFWLFNAFRAQQTLWDGVWATVFSANWHFAIVGTDYFQSDGPVSPLQHYWSLSVEEQFYFVWPWVMLGILALLAKLGLQRHSRRAVLVCILTISAASFAWSIYESTAAPTWAYFSTFSRAWELGLGAVIAVTAPWWSRIPSALRPVLGWVGLIGIVFSLFGISDEQAFPAPWAALPVTATALVIVAGTGGRQRFLWPIMNPVSSYLGDVSYSLYLWHFPVIIFLAPFFSTGSILYYAVCVAVMMVAAILCYHFIENPVRRSKWLEPRPKTARRRSRRRPAPFSPVVLYSGVAALVVGTVILSVAALLPRPIPINSAAYGNAVASPESPATLVPAEPVDAISQLRSEVRTAARATSWPQFDPPIDNLADQRVPQWTENDCIDVSEENIDLCVYGNVGGERTAVVLGDSIAVSWLPAIIGALEPAGYRVQSLTMQGCPVAATDVYPSASSQLVYEKCNEHRDWARAQVERLNPSLIIMSDSFLSLERLVSGAKGDAARAEWESAYSEAITSLPAETAKVNIMAPPGAKNLQECYTPISTPADCMRPIMDEWNILRSAERSSSDAAGVTFVDVEDWFCDGPSCPAFVGTMAVYADTGHLTGAFSSRLAPVVAEALGIEQLPPS
jgi:peptidoglycan/LPS O-acetylase OafA/YrhL